MARLLAIVRWLKHHGTLIRNITMAEHAANNHTQVLEDVADALWTSRSARNSASIPRPSVASAVQVLASAPLPSSSTQPTSSQHHTPFPSKSDDLRPEKHSNHHLTPEASEVTQHLGYSSSPYSRQRPQPPSSSLGSVSPSVTDRLAIATRNAIRESLLHLGPVNVLTWRSGLADVCVKVGVEGLWAADVSLDSLDPDTAILRIHAVFVYVANHLDCPTTHPRFTPSNLKSSFSRITPSQHAILRNMANIRINSAVKAARAIANSNSPVHSTTVALCALRDMMMDDVCSPLIMSLLRAQARALKKGPWSSFLEIEGDDSSEPRTTPLTIRYWSEYRESAVMQISEFQSAPSVESKSVANPSNDVTSASSLSCSNGFIRRKSAFVNCTHDPQLPTTVELGAPSVSFDFEPSALNLEHALLFAIRARIRSRLHALADQFRSRHTQLRIHPACVKLTQMRRRGGGYRATEALPSPEDALLICAGTGADPVGIDIRIFSMTGGIRVRPYGAAAMTLPSRGRDGFELWTGSKYFSSKDDEVDAIMSAFELIRARIKLNAAARSVCALDIGVSNTLPPGTASVAATASPDRAASQLVPPFAPLERRAPRRFLTLSPPPPIRDLLHSVHHGGGSSQWTRAGARNVDRSGPTKRPRLTYATTSDALVFIQESSFVGEDWFIGEGLDNIGDKSDIASLRQQGNETVAIDRYNGTAAAAAAWAVTREVVERRLRRDSLLRAFVGSNVASSAQMPHMRSSEGGDLHLDSASRVLLKVKCEPLPVRRAELLLRGYDAWQVRLSLLPSIFDSTDCVSARRDDKQKESNEKDDGLLGNLWSVGVACSGSQLTFTYPSANTVTVKSFFRDLTRARTAAALARGVPPSRFYRVLRKSPVRIVVGIGPYGYENGMASSQRNADPLYTATVEYVYSKGNSGGFSLTFSPSKHTMDLLAPFIEEALDASGGQVGGILAGLLERACPVAAAAESAVRQRGNGKIRFVTALRVRAMFNGRQRTVARNENRMSGIGTIHPVSHAVDVDARGGRGLVTVIDVGRATAVMIQQGLAHKMSAGAGGSQRRSDYTSLPKWDEIVERLTRRGDAEPQRAGSTVVLRMEVLEQFLTDLVTSASAG